MKSINHYEYLEDNFEKFLKKLGLENYSNYAKSMIIADGDKCYQYQQKWENNNIPFHHGAALYLITKLPPYTEEVRQTKDGWIAPDDWVIINYLKFKDFLN